MTSRVSHTSIDCHNAYELSEWWKQVLGYEDIPDDPNEPGHEECMIRSGAAGHHILFIEVPEAKSGKNRIHFDLRSTDVTQDEETERAAGRRRDARRGSPWHSRPGHRVVRDGRSRGQRVLHPQERRRVRRFPRRQVTWFRLTRPGRQVPERSLGVCSFDALGSRPPTGLLAHTLIYPVLR